MTKVIWPTSNILGALGLLLFALVAPTSAQAGGRTPDLGDYGDLAAPAGSKVAFVAYAEGAQIYRWDGASWIFVAPEAMLYSGDDEDSEVVGIHYAGPTWESNSGSKVKAAVAKRATPDASAIPWLLLEAKSSEGPGIFHRVAHVQRPFTTGGPIPVEPGDFAGDEEHVPYTAWYYFYR